MARRRQIIILFVLALLYLCTGVFGWQSHADELESRALKMWQDYGELERQLQAEGLSTYTTRRHEGGPKTKVNWAFPVLPGVLVADSQYSIDPTNGRGGPKIVLFYGFGSVEVCILGGWIS